ncbi:hypothetical protein GCM10009712_09410 [Pseudarthrobacter sulfonivorans]
MDLSGFNHHIDVIVGEQGAETFGDPSEFKFQNSDQSRSVRDRTGRDMGLQHQPSACSPWWAVALGQASNEKRHRPASR